MASSEIQTEDETVVGESAKNTNTVTIDNVFTASSYGDFEKLRKFVEQDGASLSLPDNDGYYALQWAALNNLTEIVQYIIEHGGDVNAVDDNTQQTALHWAAVRGWISVADVLLQNGAQVEAADVYGYRAVHVAAQYGQTSFLNHIVVKYNADFDVPDNNGRSPLHWAAYEGFVDTVRWLLSRDASPKRQDIEGTNWPMILAMQGDAYTGKSTLAWNLALKLKCPVISLDDFLDASEPTDEQDTLISHTFNIIANIVKTQISLGLSVVVDSPLSRRSLLQKLVALISTENHHNTQLLIVECKPENEYAYQLRFEESGLVIYGSRWHKPKGNWPLPKVPRDYTDDDIPRGVSKLVVETSNLYTACNILRAMFDVTSCGYGHIAKHTDFWHFIHMDKEEQFTSPCSNCCSIIVTGTEDGNLKLHENFNFHRFTLCEAIDHCDKLCGACDNQVLDSYYTCKFCPLTLHESCAELARGEKKQFVPENFPKFMPSEPHMTFSFPVERPCAECKKEGNGFSCKCKHCLFESHLKSRLVPTVVRHKALDQFLTLWLNSDVGGSTRNYMCLACRKYGQFASYFHGANCAYHPECALLPPSVLHSHGGYTHDLEMITRRVEKMEDYLCDCCLNKMDPTAWYYICSQCDISMHLECAFQDFDSGGLIVEA